MPKQELVGLRLDPRAKAALEQAAAAYDRRVPALAREIIIRWLWAYGWLHNEKPDAAPFGRV